MCDDRQLVGGVEIPIMSMAGKGGFWVGWGGGVIDTEALLEQRLLDRCEKTNPELYARLRAKYNMSISRTHFKKVAINFCITEDIWLPPINCYGRL